MKSAIYLGKQNIEVSGRWNIEDIITDEYNIENINEAIRRAADAENAFNVVISFD